MVIQLLLYHCLAVKSPTDRRTKSATRSFRASGAAAQFTGALLVARLIMMQLAHARSDLRN